MDVDIIVHYFNSLIILKWQSCGYTLQVKELVFMRDWLDIEDFNLSRNEICDVIFISSQWPVFTKKIYITGSQEQIYMTYI